VDKGLKVVELSSGETRTTAELKKTPFFVKVSGDMDAFSAFCSSISTMAPELAFSKIIILFTSRQQATYVLRLELLTPS
jgi:Tfp pilus assembly protein PilO